MARENQAKRVIATNRRAHHDYEILDELECGIQLVGTEVKSLRAGRASIVESFGLFRGEELWLVRANVPEYAFGNVYNHKPERDRKLLAHRRELEKWRRQVLQRGKTMVPLELYFQGHLVKIKMALVAGKKLYDKRQRDREKTAERDIDRAMSQRRR